MKKIQDKIKEIHDSVIQELNLTAINKNTGKIILGSLGFVELIIRIEEFYKIDLDDVLIDLRNTKNLNEVTHIVNRFLY